MVLIFVDIIASIITLIDKRINGRLIIQYLGAIIAKNVAPIEFKELIDSKKEGVVLDVRTPQEIAQGAIAGHVDMNFYAPDFKEQLKTLDKSKPVMVYCAVGGRSGSAMQLLSSMGFKEVYNLAGGIRAWQSQGMPLNK